MPHDLSQNAAFMEDSDFSIPPEGHLLEMLVCPVTGGPLIYDAEKNELISEMAALAFPVRDGIPIMIPDEARPL